MKSLRLTVEHTAETIHPVHRFVCESDAVERELLLQGNTTDDPETFLFYVEGDCEAYEAVLDGVPALAEYDITPADGDGFFLYVREASADTDRAIFEAFQRETVVVVPPVAFLPDQTMRLTVIGHGDQLQASLGALPDELAVRIDYVGEYAGEPGRSLTDRQREAVAAAHELGYYEVPREAGLVAVAAALDCGEGTASRLLRRAEARLVAEALEGRHVGPERSLDG
ncbi:helix-turn-helix domain-containing protein [Salinirubellus salinus]|uniref:helix-turn-helix domain-containing protein n=1 Tax=Salinirubellus salinus TaxID=1364945 RepID=UPI0026E52B68|nr:helix-turn-helix domain-containing protein [Salinirubellus salinus]